MEVAFGYFFVEALGLVVEALVGDGVRARLIAFVSPASVVHYFFDWGVEPGGAELPLVATVLRERHVSSMLS